VAHVASLARRQQLRTVALLVAIAAGSCSGELRLDLPKDSADGGLDATTSGIGPTDNPSVPHDAGRIADAGRLSVDAFFIDDPPPPQCGPDGDMTDAGPVDGTPECPSDKNREGCACAKAGEKQACWPGKRVNRMRGRCKDGITTCSANTEFGPHWGPCEGYVLPADGAHQGPEACGCFSNGKWALNNLVPCVFQDDKNIYLYSSRPSADGYECDPVAMTPPAVPTSDWNSSTINVDCAGQFKLCYTMKAGRVADPKPSDCQLMHACVDVWYSQPGKDVALPNLPGWSSMNMACSRQFIEQGGYGEMSVQGLSVDCDAVDDGHGAAYVFKRTSYCLPSCGMTPNLPECMGCATGGSGQF
jgi:hypothetical protein